MVFGPLRQALSCSVTLNGIDLPVVRSYQVPRCHSDAITSLVRPRQPFHRSRLWAVCTKHSLVAQRRSHCQSSTDHSACGVVTCCGGQRALLTRLSSGNWGFSTRPARLTVEHCPCLAAWRRSIQELAHRSPQQSSALRLMSLALGHIGVALSWSIIHAGSQNSLALDQEELQALYDVGSVAEWRQHLIALGISGLCLRSTLSASTAHPRTLNHMIYGRGVDPAEGRCRFFARHGHDPRPGRRTCRYGGDASGCSFCGSVLGILPRCVASCPPPLPSLPFSIPQSWCLVRCDKRSLAQSR